MPGDFVMAQSQELVLSLSAGRDLEQRANVRYRCGDGTVMRLAVRPEFRGYRTLLHDFSSGGVGLLMERPVDVGTVLVIELRSGNSDVGSNHLARVVHVRRHPTPPNAPWAPRRTLALRLRQFVGLGPTQPAVESWFIGCRFHQPLNEDEIRRLLA
jgi:hypothetical protein